MRTQISRMLRQSHSLAKISSRGVTTTTEPKKTLDMAVRIREDYQGAIQESLIPPQEVPNANYFTYTFQKINRWQHKVFTECSVTGRNYTYGQFMDGTMRLSAALRKLFPDLGNSTVAFLVPNSPEFPHMLFGCLSAGATVSPMNPTYTPYEIAAQMKDSGATVLFTDELLEPLADAALKELGRDLPVIVNGVSKYGRPNVRDIISDSSAPMADPVEIDPLNKIAILPYSSGTTGKPKGVRLSHAAFSNNIPMYLNKYITNVVDADGDHQECFLGLLPFFHIYGILATLTGACYYGAKIVTMPKFDPMNYISTLKKHKMTTLQVVPSLVHFLAECPTITREDLSSVKSVVVGSSPLSHATSVAMKEKHPSIFIQQGYGSSEALLTHITLTGKEILGYMGPLLPNVRAKILDIETGELLPPNACGELYIQSPAMMSGYHNNEQATKEALDEEGWLRTGDVAYYTEDGYYAVVDRIKELIKVKGFQVSPTELEEILCEHPGIEEVGIVGVPHSQFGEAPRAYIVKADDDLTESNIHLFLKDKAAKHKQLAGGIEFIDELPKNMVGKVLKKELRAMSGQKA